MQLDASLLDEIARCYMRAALEHLLSESDCPNEKPAAPDGATAGRDHYTGDHYDANNSRFQSFP